MFIERGEAIQTLHQLAIDAGAGQGALSLISGEAGIGKTTLLREFRSQYQEDYHFLWGGCDALLTPRVLGPVHDMSIDLGESIQDLLQTDASITKLLPELVATLTSIRKPVIMIFEDVHWADNATLDLLKCLGRRISALRALLVISYRQHETDPRHALTNLLGDFPQASTTRIELSAISAEGTELLAKHAGRKIEELHAATGGNPFFVTELLADDTWDQGNVPASIQDAIGSRMNRLTQTEQNFLETISVIPHAIEESLIQQLFPENGDALILSCEQKNFLRASNNGKLQFRHELARLGTKSRTSTLWQKKVHKKIADILATNSVNTDFERIAFHAYAAKMGSLVLECAPKAAAIASQAGAHNEAAAHLKTALEFVSGTSIELAATLYENWSYESGLVLIDNEVIDARHKALELWKKLNRADKIGENLRWLSRLHWYMGQSDKANQFTNEAIEVLETTDASTQKAMAYSMKSQFFMLNDRMEEAILWGEKALEIEARCNDPDIRCHALNNIGTAMVFRDNVAGIDHLNESLDLALKHNLHEHAARVYTNMADYAVGCRNFELAEKTISDGIVFDSNHDLDSWTHYLIGLLAQLRMKQGRLEEAETISLGVLKLDKLTLLMKLPALLVLARTQSRLGRPDAQDFLDRALNDSLSTTEAQYIIPARLAHIEAAWLNEKHDIAKQHIASILTSNINLAGGWRDGEVALWMHRYGIESKIFKPDDLPKPYRLEINGDYNAAAREWQTIGSPYPAALALLNAPVSMNNTETLARAMQLLGDSFASGTMKKATHIASSAGVVKNLQPQRRGPRKTSRQHPLGLTKKEQEILPWIVEGLSNKEISRRFSRSERTIENHIASIFKKLNVHSRMEALLRAKNEPWLLTSTQTSQRPAPDAMATNNDVFAQAALPE